MSYPKCPHCPRDFHGLAITERLEEMRAEYRSRVLYPDGIGEEDYATSAILGDYRHDTDTSRVLCPGSTFIGPRALTPAEAKRDQRWARIIQVEDDRTARLTPLNVDGIPDGEPMFERELSFTLHLDPLTWRRFVEALRGASDAIGAFQLPPDSWLSDDPELETPQQRALPRPSTTPPMWARQPNQRRRNRRI